MDSPHPYVVLHNGVRMPQLGLGVYKSAEGAETVEAVQYALKVGYRHIDTASFYANERSVGDGIRASGLPREEVFVTTKLWNTDQGYESTLAAFERSRKQLGFDYVDLYLIHWPGGRKQIEAHGKKYLDSWRAMEKLYAEKKVRAIGVSNFHIHHVEDILAMCTVPPMVNQVELHPELRQGALCDYCASKHIAVTAWSPLARGAVLGSSILQTIADAHHRSTAQIILRWDIQRGIITIPKSTHPERIRENADIFGFELSAEEMRQIDAMNTDKRTGGDPEEINF